MDKIDKKILKELLENSRLPLSQIGKRVRLSRENVYYRIQNLVKQGIIRDFVASIDFTSLGFQQFVAFIEFDKIDKEKESQIIEYLKKEKSVSWIGVLSGNWSLTFDIFAKSNFELNNFIGKFFNHFEQNIGDYIILNLQESNYFFNKIIDENISIPNTKRKENVKVDAIDLKIIKKVIFYYHYNKTGVYDFDIGIIVKNSSELRDFINQLRKDFYDEIKISNSFLVLEEVSSHNLPKVVFS